MLTLGRVYERIIRLSYHPIWISCLLLLAVGATPAFAGTNFGAVTVGTSSPAAVTLTFGASATLGLVKVVTQGATGLDFQQSTANGGTCTVGSAYGADQSCTVNVVFTPTGVGLRLGAVLLYDNASTPNLLATAFLSGVGNGGLLNFSSTQATVGSGLVEPRAVAVDAAGNVYIAILNSTTVVKVPAGGGSQTTVGTGLGDPTGVAVDGAGNIYISDALQSLVVVVPAGGGVQTTVGSGLAEPEGVAVDGAGNVYIADFANNRVVMVPAGGGAQTTVGTGLADPEGVAVDGAGNIYIASYGNGVVVKVPAGGGAQTTVGNGLQKPSGVAVDGGGNVYISDLGTNLVVEVPAAGGAQTTVGSGLNSPSGVAVDGGGDIYIVDNLNNRLVEVQQTQLPSPVSLGTVTTGGAPSTASVSFTNIGSAPLTLSSAPLTLNTELSTNQYQESDSCGGSVAVNSSCTLNITFSPTGGLPPPGATVPGTLTLTDNAPNSPQSIGLTAVAISNPATKLAINGPPATAEVGARIPEIVVIQTEDSGGYVDETPRSITLTVTGPPGFTPQTYTQGTLGGVANFFLFDMNPSSLTIAGTYTYTAMSSGLANATATESVFGAYSFTTPQPVEVASAPLTVNFAFNPGFISSATLGAVSVLSQGLTGLDFQQVTGGSCTVGSTYLAGQSCTVNVVFIPKAIGQRLGAVQLYDNSENLLGTAYLSGVGSGGLVSFSTTQTTVGSGLSLPRYLAIDAAGDVYISDSANNRIVEEPAGGGSQTVLTINAGDVALNGPEGLALDGAGNLYIADFFNNRIVIVPLAGGAQSFISPNVNGVGVNGPEALATDGAGNLYITDVGNNRVVEVQGIGEGVTNAGPYSLSTVGSGLSNPRGVAADSSGNVFISDTGNSRVVEVPAGGGPQTTLNTAANGVGLNAASGISADGAGNVYIGDYGNNRVVVVPNGGGAPTTIGTGLNLPFSAVSDGIGDVYIADNNNNRVVVVQQTQVPSTVSLGDATVGATPAANSLSFTNIGNASLTLSNAISPSQYQESDTCGGSVAVNSNCTLNLTFTPTAGTAPPYGTTVPGTLTLTDNAPVSPQVINLTGTALLTTVTATPQPETEVYGQQLSAAVTLSGTTVGSATGTITFTAGGKTICTFTGTLGSMTTCNAPSSGLSVGTYPVAFTYSGDNHYVATTGSSTLAVTPAPLTVSVANATRVYGAANPTFSGTISGVVAGDTVTATYSTTATTNTPAGPVPITATVVAGTGTSLSNYSITNNPGMLTITQAPLVVTVNNATRPFGVANPTFTSNVTGLQNGDTVSVAYTTTAVPTSTPGTYAVTATVSATGNTNLSNYAISYNPGTLTITNVAFTSAPETEGYNQAFPETLGFTPSGSASAPTGTVTFTSSGKTLCTTMMPTSGSTVTCNAANSGFAVGTYPVTYTYSGDTNYAGSTGFVNLAVSPVGPPMCSPLIVANPSGLIVTATPSCSDPQNETLSLSIDWMDGTSSVVTNNVPVTHTYSAPNCYPITLTATDSGGSSSSPVIQVVVLSVGVFAGSPTTSLAAIPVPSAVLALPTPPVIGLLCNTVSQVINGVEQTPVSAASVGINCTTSPTTITLSQALPLFNVTVNTTAPTSTASMVQPRERFSAVAALCLSIPGFGLIGLGALLGYNRKRRWDWLLVLLVGFFSIGLTSCGGHYTAPTISTGSTTVGPAATPSGLYHVILTPNTSCPGCTSATSIPPAFLQTSLIVSLTVAPVSH